MRKISVALLIALTGCAHAWIPAWEDQDFILCGNRWCDHDCLAEAAQNACPAGYMVKGGFVDSSIVGAHSDSYGNTYLTRRTSACSKLHCMGPLFQRAPSASQAPPPPDSLSSEIKTSTDAKDE